MRKIILDVDTGVDDALAIMLACKAENLELLAVTAVAGNVPLEVTLENSLKLVEWCGRRDVKVAAGCSHPLANELRTAEEAHGKNGMNNVDFEKATYNPVEKNAVDLIIELVKMYPHEVSIACVAPLTNLATAITKAPEIVSLIKEVAIMGGAAFCPGNANAVAEFNIWADPKAAKIVFDAGLNLTMISLDVTQKTRLCEHHVQDMYKANPIDINEKLLRLLEPDFAKDRDPKRILKGIGMHDPLTVGYLMDPTFIKTEDYHVDIETTNGAITEGMTVVDRRICAAEPNVHVSVQVEAERFLKEYARIVGN